MLKLGAHVSAAGGVYNIFQRGADLGCECLQLFTRAPSRWAAPTLSDEVVEQFHSERAKFPKQSVIAHDLYLTNLASERDEVRERSIDNLIEEIKRCHRLGLDGLVCHIGANKEGLEIGLTRYARALSTVLAETQDAPVPILLETCAGQGSTLGYQLDHIAEIVEFNDNHERLGVCVDTCHIFVAGYDLREESLYHAFWDEFDTKIGLSRLKAFHLNDSKKPFASRVDRHDHIGLGEIGETCFQLLLADSRFKNLPAVIETPESETKAGDNLDRLKGYRQAGLEQQPA